MVFYFTDTVLRNKILSAFKVPIGTASGSTNSFVYIPNRINLNSPDPADMMIHQWSVAGTPSAKVGYQRIDTGAGVPYGITRPASQDRRHTITEAKTNYPRNIITGTYQANAGGGNYDARYWYIPADYSATKFTAYLAALAADTTIAALPPHGSKQPIINILHLNDFSESQIAY